MKVGHHRVHSYSTRPKTLHLDKLKRDAEKIDLENNKILKAIMRVKPTKDLRLNRSEITKQEYLAKNISRSHKMSL